MRRKLSKFASLRIPFKDDEIPLRTEENLEEHLQAGISFLQTQQQALRHILDMLVEFSKLTTEREANEQEEEDREEIEGRLHELKTELGWMATLEFNRRNLFSGDSRAKSFKLFKDAGPKAPRLKQHPLPHHLKPLNASPNPDDLSPTDAQRMLNALHEMLGQTDAAESDLQNSFKALTGDSTKVADLHFIEKKTKSWVSEIIERSDGLTTQANVSLRKVEGLIQGLGGATGK